MYLRFNLLFSIRIWNCRMRVEGKNHAFRVSNLLNVCYSDIKVKSSHSLTAYISHFALPCILCWKKTKIFLPVTLQVLHFTDSEYVEVTTEDDIHRISCKPAAPLSKGSYADRTLLHQKNKDNYVWGHHMHTLPTEQRPNAHITFCDPLIDTWPTKQWNISTKVSPVDRRHCMHRIALPTMLKESEDLHLSDTKRFASYECLVCKSFHPSLLPMGAIPSPCQVYFQWGLFRPLVKFTSNGSYSVPLPSLLPMGAIPSLCQVYFQWRLFHPLAKFTPCGGYSAPLPSLLLHALGRWCMHVLWPYYFHIRCP